MSSRRTGRAALLLAGLLGLAGSAFAEARLSQTVDRSEVGTEDVFTVTITVAGADSQARLELPESDDFEVLGRSQSTQVSIAGGGMQRFQRYTLRMRANRAGRLTLPGAVLTEGGRQIRAEPLELTARPGHVARGSRADEPDPTDPFAGMGFPSLPGFPNPGQLFRGFDDDDFPDPFGRAERPLAKGDVQLRLIPDRRSVYAGEQATVSLYLLSRAPISGLQGLQMPKIEGALVEELQTPKQVRAEERVIDGVPYRAYLLARRALFPMKAGTLEIGPAQVSVTAGGLFSTARLTPKSAPLSLEVKPLPPGGPGSGQEAVGEWKLSVDASPREAKLGEPITVRLTAEGIGDLKGLALPRPELPSGLKVYEPTTTDKKVIEDGKVGGRRVQELVVIAERTGDFTLPPLELPYFDPETGQHEVSRTQPLSFTVVAAPGVTPVAQADVPATPKNVIASGGPRPIRHDATLDAAPPAPWRRPLWLGAMGGPLFAVAAVELVSALRRRAASRSKEPSGRELVRSARRHLSAAEQLKSRPSEFYAEVERGLSAFLESRLKARPGGLTRDALEERLKAAGMQTPQRERLLAALDGCHAGRYAPETDPAAMEHALALAREALEGRPAR